jgi:hypothetical protein
MTIWRRCWYIRFIVAGTKRGENKERVTRIAIRYTFPQELNALLEGNGFRILEQYGDWDKSLLTKDSPSIISVCSL